jgi:hypothetical protein
MYNDTGIHVMGGAGHVQMYIRSVHVIYWYGRSWPRTMTFVAFM